VSYFKSILSANKLITNIEQTQVVIGNNDIVSFNMIGKNAASSVEEAKQIASSLMSEYPAIFDVQIESTDYQDKGRNHSLTINFLLRVQKIL
jgi:hypothetical protein